MEKSAEVTQDCILPAVLNIGIVSRYHCCLSVPQIPIPSVPTYQPTTTVLQRLEAIQKYIRELQYPFNKAAAAGSTHGLKK